MSELMLFSGSANRALAEGIAAELKIELGAAAVGRFSDGEVSVEIHENVRGHDVFLLQPTCAPTNDNLMELMIMADAVRRASATRLTAVIPYFGYARQDRRPRSARVSISAKVVADMLSSVGIDRMLTVDLHADQIQGFFNMPVDNVYGSPVLVDHMVSAGYENPIIVSPDVGGVVRARALAKLLNDADLAIIDKRRPKPNEAEVMNRLSPTPAAAKTWAALQQDLGTRIGHGRAVNIDPQSLLMDAFLKIADASRTTVS